MLGLREKDLIATFNWDPLVWQAYKRNHHVGALPKLVMLHGSVTMGVCYTDRIQGAMGEKCQACVRPFEPVPVLFPITKKDYNSNPFIRNQWDNLEHALKDGYRLSIVGYRAPDSDAEAIKLLKSPWLQNKLREFAEIEIVDKRPRAEVENTWKEFFVRQHYSVYERWEHLFSLRYPRRSCEALFAATMQNDPWMDNPMPMTKTRSRPVTLSSVQRWIKPLRDEELAAKEDGGLLSSCTPRRSRR